jgi:hypothetical protein
MENVSVLSAKGPLKIVSCKHRDTSPTRYVQAEQIDEIASVQYAENAAASPALPRRIERFDYSLNGFFRRCVVLDNLPGSVSRPRSRPRRSGASAASQYKRLRAGNGRLPHRLCDEHRRMHLGPLTQVGRLEVGD